MPRPTRCACPDCTPGPPVAATVDPDAHAAGQGTREPSPAPQTPAGGLTQDAVELFARLTVASNNRLGQHIEALQQRRPRVDYTTPGYRPPEAA